MVPQSLTIVLSLVILFSVLVLILCIVYYHFGRERRVRLIDRLVEDDEYVEQP